MTKPETGPLGIAVSQWRLFILVLAVGLALSVFYFFERQGIDDTAAMYVGLPLLLALAMSLTPKTKSTVGAVMKGLTIAILLSVPVFNEGFVCILLASPILYSVSALVAFLVDKYKKSRNKTSKLHLSIVTIILVFASLEGTEYEIISFNDEYQVVYSDTVAKDVESIRRNLVQPIFSPNYRPVFLRVFPYPVSITSEGLDVGAEHKLDFVYKKWFVANAHAGSVVYRVTESTDTHLRFDIPYDNSYLSHYLTWQAVEVLLEPVSVNETKITWKLNYKRNLDPAWYFGPLQYYAVWLAAKVMVNNAAS